MKYTRERTRAQGMTEYIIIVILVALGAVIAVKVYWDSLNTKYVKAGADLEAEVRP